MSEKMCKRLRKAARIMAERHFSDKNTAYNVDKVYQFMKWNYNHLKQSKAVAA
jgi:hypothetical protein